MNRKSKVPEIQAVDVFCGVGGLTHGLAKSGISVKVGVDLDPSCRFAFEANNSPAVFIERDVKTLKGSEIAAYVDRSKPLLLAGCAPCQPFSTYSQPGRKSGEHRDWELLRSFSRLVGELKPDLVAMENVAQLSAHPIFDEFVDSLVEYNVEWSIVDCSTIGVPQTRKRLVLLASQLGEQGLTLHGKSSKAATVASAIKGMPPLKAGEACDSDPMHVACKLSEINLRRIKASKPGGSWRDWPADLRAECHSRSTGDTYPSVYGRMEWGKPSPTMTTQCFGYGNGRFGHPEQDRAITLREAALLQTFPKKYKFLKKGEKASFSRLGRLIGNAVPVRLGEVIGETLLAHYQAL